MKIIIDMLIIPKEDQNYLHGLLILLLVSGCLAKFTGKKVVKFVPDYI